MGKAARTPAREEAAGRLHLPERTAVLEPSTAGTEEPGGHLQNSLLQNTVQVCRPSPTSNAHGAARRPQHPGAAHKDRTPRTTPASRGRQGNGGGKSPPTRCSGCWAMTSPPQGLKSTTVDDNPARWDLHAGRQADWPTRRCRPLLLIPGLQLFSRVAQENVILLLGIIKLMSLGPVVAGGVGEYVAVVVEAAGCDRLV